MTKTIISPQNMPFFQVESKIDVIECACDVKDSVAVIAGDWEGEDAAKAVDGDGDTLEISFIILQTGNKRSYCIEFWL